MPPLDNIEALAFDVFGTVVDWHGSVTRELVAFGKKYSLPGEGMNTPLSSVCEQLTVASL